MKTRKTKNAGKETTFTLLENGFIADGSGKNGYIGNLLIKGNKIEKISEKKINADARRIDCSGKVIAPGFIDMHSHNDWFLPSKGKSEMKTPFTAQGITTFVGGNCGFSAAGLKPESPYLTLIQDNLFKEGNDGIRWASMAQYFAYIRKVGMSHNLINLAGHGTARASIRGTDPSPLKEDELKEMLRLLEESMDQGAAGVSLGLQYEPGIFATDNELFEIARLVKRKDKILTVHAKALSALSGTYPLKPFGKAHNLIALEELIKLARDTGVRLQVSHLIFVGSKTWKTCERALSLIDRARNEGIDLMFDTYSHHCGGSIIHVLLPPWFLAHIPDIYRNRKAIARLTVEFNLMKKLLGFGFNDIQIAHANDHELNQYNGMFLSDIAKVRKLSNVANYLDFARRSGGIARVLMHRYSNPDIVRELVRHPASLFMTDAWVEPTGVQNPAAFGCFPRFLQMARETGIISLEDAVRKMTGANAERFKINKRGLLSKGNPADITVFDWKIIRDNTTVKNTSAQPEGIAEVFINGVHVVKKGKVNPSARPGTVITGHHP